MATQTKKKAGYKKYSTNPLNRFGKKLWGREVLKMKRIIIKKGHLYSYEEIGQMFGVTGSMVWQVAKQLCWSDVC